MRARTLHQYSAYGLGIHSTEPLPPLEEGESPADLVVRERLHADGPVADPWACLRVKDIAHVEVRGGREILYRCDGGVDRGALRAILLGPALGLAIHQRGRLVLHASAVAIGNEAALFLGSSGAGKSTTAGAMLARGHRLVSDDVTVVDALEDPPRVVCGYPQIKLHPEAHRSILLPDASVNPSHSRTKKVYLGVRGAGERARLPIARIYLLAEAEEPRVEPLSRGLAAEAFVRNSYCAMRPRMIGPSGHLAQCAALATTVAARVLSRPLDFERLEAMVDAVEDDFFRGGVRASA